MANGVRWGSLSIRADVLHVWKDLSIAVFLRSQTMELRIRVGFDARLRAPNRACAGVRRDLPPSGAHLIQPGILKVVARPGIELRAQGFSVSRLRQGTNQYANNRQNRG